jgi:hypothetical protein
MRHLTWLVALFALVGLAYAADQTILGKQVLVKDPKPGVDPTKRKIVGHGKESASPNTIGGDPTVSGAVVRIFVEGAFPVSQTFPLPPGTDPASGKPFWSTSGSGFTYKDKAGTNGAVTVAQIKKSGSGTFQIKVVALAKHSPIALVPPNPGSSACLLLEIGGGDRYHVLLPPAPNSSIKKNDAKTFRITNALTEGFCPECTTAGTACNDNNSCTTADTCSAAGICVGTPVAAGTTCEDGACTGIGTCNGAGVCVAIPLPAGTACDDGNACTGADTCTTAHMCVGIPLPAGTGLCSDGNACTGPDVCNGAGLCSGPALPNGTVCGTAMTCTAGVCS